MSISRVIDTLPSGAGMRCNSAQEGMAMRGRKRYESEIKHDLMVRKDFAKHIAHFFGHTLVAGRWSVLEDGTISKYCTRCGAYVDIYISDERDEMTGPAHFAWCPGIWQSPASWRLDWTDPEFFPV